MKQILVLLLMGMLLFAGCVEQPEEEAPQAPPEPEEEQPPEETPEEPEEAPPAPEEPETPEEPEYTSTAHSQEDCSMLAPNCESCLSKKNCGWCKESNSCHFGDSGGPETGSCKEDEWTVTVPGCSVVDDGESCSDLTNCVACLSGSGCTWCIQGSVCAPEGTSEECFGGWLQESYQCNYASR
ncbi:TPA: hypothetical protein EYP38_04400 [Candidatus Micrarchaeota archaeon]|nr:hypothetical protein [Candidatus Micrarchaeota archaeon]